jgi:excisionase family DNA binding protein
MSPRHVDPRLRPAAGRSVAKPEPEVSTPDLLGEILTSEQVAQMLAMRRSTVEDYARRGVLPSIKLGRHRRYVRSDLLRAIEHLR